MRRPTQPHELLEQELNILLQGNVLESMQGDNDGNSDGQSEDIKKRVRTIKNRLAAKKSREQARSYVQELESNLNRIRQQNEDLARRLALAEAENEILKRGKKLPLSLKDTAPNATKNCDGESAALPSLQLDAVLVAVMVLVSLIPRSHPCHSRTLLPPQYPLPAASLSRSPGVEVPRSCRSLRRAEDLLCMSHIHQSVQA